MYTAVSWAEPPKNSAWDASVFQVKRFLKKNLKDPDSYKGIEWSKVVRSDKPGCEFSVRHKYRAKNSFGGYAISNQIFCMDMDGNVTKAFNYRR